MNKYILLLLANVLLFACNTEKKTEGFELKIIVEDENPPESVAVMTFENQVKKTLDSVSFDGNEATLSGKLENPTACFIQFFGESPSQPIQLFLENGEMELTGTTTDMASMELEGSDSQDELDRLIEDQEMKKEEIAAIWKKHDEARRSGDMDKAEMYMDEYRLVMDETFKEIVQYVKDNPESAVAAYITSSELMYSVDYADLAEIADGFEEKQPNSIYTKMILDKVDKMKNVAVGAQAPEFAQPDPDGNLISLSSLRGKYVLLDFWASWCKPCRVENPNVVKMYNKYKGENFEILGVSLDKSGQKNRWLQAIEADGIEWLQVSDLKGWRNEVARLYDVSTIPRTYLIDPEGKIIAKDLRGEELMKKMEEIFPEV